VLGADSRHAAGAGHSRHYNRPLIDHRSVLLALRGKSHKISYNRNNAAADHSLRRWNSDLLLILED
jgi:hypothetical protein